MPPDPLTRRATRFASHTVRRRRQLVLRSGPAELDNRQLLRRRVFCIAITAFSGTFEYRVGKRRDMRVNASQIADDAQEIAVVDAGGDPVRSVHDALHEHGIFRHYPELDSAA